MRIAKANKDSIKFACMKFHYAKAVPVNTCGYNVYNDKNEWCGVVLFGTGANNNIGTAYGLLQGQCVELVRVALNGKQEHTSQAVAMCLKQLKVDCPLVRLVVSYADCDQSALGYDISSNELDICRHKSCELKGQLMDYKRQALSWTYNFRLGTFARRP